MSHSHRFPLFRRLWKPTLVTGAGGSAVAIWLEEILLHIEAILALILLPILASLIYLLDIFMFKSRMPRGEDLHPPQDTGVKK